MCNRHKDGIPQQLCYEFNIEPRPDTEYGRWDDPIAGTHSFRFVHPQDKSKLFIKVEDP